MEVTRSAEIADLRSRPVGVVRSWLLLTISTTATTMILTHNAASCLHWIPSVQLNPTPLLGQTLSSPLPHFFLVLIATFLRPLFGPTSSEIDPPAFLCALLYPLQKHPNHRRQRPEACLCILYLMERLNKRLLELRNLGLEGVDLTPAVERALCVVPAVSSKYHQRS